MDVIAFPYQGLTGVELGSIADSIWVQGFKSSETRSLQVSKPVNAPAPNIFDRLLRMQDFSFAAGQSFDTVADALEFIATYPGTVPGVATIQFSQQGGEIWLCYCGITKVELVDKKGAMVVFGHTITGGTWSKTRIAET